VRARMHGRTEHWTTKWSGCGTRSQPLPARRVRY